MDIFLHAPHTEGFGNSVLQALACGRPVVATRVGGIPEVVDESCAVLNPPRDIPATIDALHSLIVDESMRNRRGAPARYALSDRKDGDRLRGRF